MADYLETDDLLPEDDEQMAPEQEAENIEEKIITEDIKPTIKLDYKLKTMEERASLVNRIVESTPKEQLTSRYLEILGDYIMGALSKEERKEKTYVTDNRRLTINKRETSFEGLAEKFENGEDGLYNIITNDKNILFTPKITITAQDVEEIPGLKELRDNIEEIERLGKAATGKKKFLLKKQLIEMRKDQYVLKSIFKPAAHFSLSAKGANRISLEERRWIDENGEPQSNGLVTLFNPTHICAILCNYNALKTELKGRYSNDFYYLMEEFDKLLKRTLKVKYPLYYDLVKLKVQGKQNVEIQAELEARHGIKHSIEYISALWRNKIPKLLAEQAKEDYLIWHYTYEEEGKWKKCSKCGQLKLAHNRFFSKNKTSKDGFYSICKECRNSKK